MARHGFWPPLVIGLVLAAVAGSPLPTQAQVSVNIGVNLPGPPQLVPVPAAPAIAYAPAVDANYFYFDREYYVFSNGVWYVSRGYNGPWAALPPEFVPQPLLQVPVQYYRRPPTAWRQFRREAPPRWETHWGRRWEERRSEGQALPREREEHRGDRRDDRDRRFERR